MKKFKKVVPFVFVLCLLLSTYVFARHCEIERQTGLIELTYQELKEEDLSNNFLVFSREDCPHCVDFYEGLNKIFDEDGNLLVFYVDTNKLTQEELAEMVGCNPSHISNIENTSDLALNVGNQLLTNANRGKKCNCV